MTTAWINFARYGSPETPSLPKWPASTPGDEATMIFDKTCEVRHNFDHKLVKKLSETEFNPDDSCCGKVRKLTLSLSIDKNL